eukprot:g5908.t1
MKTSTSSSRYELLLSQVSALQTDLTKTVSMCRMLKGQNESLKQNYQRLQNEHIRVADMFEDSQRQLNELTASKDIASKQHAELLDALKEELEQQANEFQELQKKVAPPKDLELLRTKIREDISREYQDRLNTSKAETTKFQQMFYNVRREHELLKSEFEQFSTDRGKEMAVSAESHRNSLEELHKQLSTLRSAQKESKWPEKARVLQARVDELEVENRLLSVELNEITTSRDHAAVEKEKSELKAVQELSDLESRLKVETSQRLVLERQSEALNVALKKARRERSEAMKQMGQAEESLRLLKRRCDSLESQRKRELEASAAKISDEKAACTRKIQLVTQHNNELQSECAQLKIQLRGAEDAAAKAREVAKKEMLSQSETVRRKLENAEQTITRLRQENQDAMRQYADLRQSTQEELGRTQTEMAQARSDVRTAMREKSLLVQKLRLSDEARTALLLEKQREVGEATKLQGELDDLRSKLRVAQKERGRLQVESEELKKTFQNDNDENVDYNFEEKDLDEEDKLEQRVAAAKKVANRAKAAEKAVRLAAKKALAKAQKRVEDAEKRSKKYRREARKLKVQIARRRVEHESVRQEYNQNVRRLMRQVQELERNRDIGKMTSTSSSLHKMSEDALHVSDFDFDRQNAKEILKTMTEQIDEMTTPAIEEKVKKDDDE